MKYIYAPSYPCIRLICYFLSLGESVTVISGNPDIRKLCRDMKWALIEFDVDEIKRPRVVELFNISRILNFRASLRALFNRLSLQCREGQLFFSILGIDLLGLSLIKEFSRSRPDLSATYWREIQTGDTHPVRAGSFKSFVQLIYFKIIFDLDLKYYESHGSRFIGVGDQFIERNGIERYTGPDIHAVDVFRGIMVPDLRVNAVILGGYSLDMDGQLYELNSLKEIYNFIRKLVPDVYYKPHPGAEKIEDFFDAFHILPPYIPSEFLVNSAKIVISTTTTAMNYLANSGILCFSILELVGVKDNSYKQKWTEKMTRETGGRIVFVKNREEIRALCESALGIKT